MHIEYMVTNNPQATPASIAEEPFTELSPKSTQQSVQPSTTESMIPPEQVESYLLNLEGTIHNGPATQLLCAAATWAYSDLKTFAAMMSHRGLYGEFIGLNVTNEVTFVDTTAYLFLSHSKKLAILTFRGTEMTNIANWLADASTEQEPQEEGSVHGGFLTASIVVLPILSRLLRLWANGSGLSLAEGLILLSKKTGYPDEVFPTTLESAALEQLAERANLARLREDPNLESTRFPNLEQLLAAEEESARQRLENLEWLAERLAGEQRELMISPTDQALYICGHSLGGAFASMAGAVLHLDPALRSVRGLLRSIYTFGAPMCTDKTLARTLDKDLGKRVFRHRYERDIVPLLPGRLQGSYSHFGNGYMSSKKGGVWVRANRYEDQVFGALLANFIGILAWAKEKVTLLQWVPLPFSWSDHSPLRYMRTSQAPRAGWEILGEELSDDVGRYAGRVWPHD